jgi:hypothetical protein
MLKSSGLILQPSEGIDLPVVEGFLSVKNIIAPAELWIDDDCEIVTVEMKEMDLKYSC